MSILEKVPVRPKPRPVDLIPLQLWCPVRKFLQDRRTGNVKLNIKDGRVMGVHLEQIITVKTNR